MTQYELWNETNKMVSDEKRELQQMGFGATAAAERLVGEAKFAYAIDW